MSIAGVVFLAFGAFLPAKPLSDLIGISAGSLIFPGSSGREVRLVFSIPEARIMQGEYKEALLLLQAMIPLDPGRLEVYTRIMKLAAVKMNQPENRTGHFQNWIEESEGSEGQANPRIPV